MKVVPFENSIEAYLIATDVIDFDNEVLLHTKLLKC